MGWESEGRRPRLAGSVRVFLGVGRLIMLIRGYRLTASFILFTGVLCIGGCQAERFSLSVLNPLNLQLPFLPYERPLRIGIVCSDRGVFNPANWDFTGTGSPWNPLRLALERSLNKPVQVEPLKGFQVAAHLQSGRLDFALLSAADYLSLEEEYDGLGKVLAISEVRRRQGLIVAKASSSIEHISDIRGKRFAFGPRDDAVLFAGAIEALEAAGVKASELQKELLPIPNSFQTHVSSREAAFEVVYGVGTEVGVVDADEYEAYPESGGSFLLRTFSKADFRILGRTAEVVADTIDEGPFVASLAADPKDVERVRAFLLRAGQENRRALASMGLAGFRHANGDVAKEMARLSSQVPAAVRFAGFFD